MLPGGWELKEDEKGAPGMAGMQTNNQPGKRWAQIRPLMEGVESLETRLHN